MNVNLQHNMKFTSQTSSPFILLLQYFLFQTFVAKQAHEVPEMCTMDVMVMTSWEFKDSNDVSYEEIHNSELYGFQLFFCPQCRVSLTMWGKIKI